MLQYRGYGHSQGSPSKHGLQQDAQAGLNYLLGSQGNTTISIDTSRVFVMGHSLGGAVALDLASRNKDAFKGVIVDNTFVSLRALLPDVLPPYGWMAAIEGLELWDNIHSVRQIYSNGTFDRGDKMDTGNPLPMLCIQGGKDELFPQWHMQELFKEAKDLACPFDPFPNDRDEERETEEIDDLSASWVVSSDKRKGKDACPVRIAHFPEGNHIHTSKEPGYGATLAAFIGHVLSRE